RTSCKAALYIGDSTSEGLTSPEYLPPPSERIDAQLARVGARTSYFSISGARSIEERYEDEPNAYESALAWKEEGFEGCWVLALGTNDTADVFVGSSVGNRERIEKMMSVAGRQPVLWVNVKSLVPNGPYAAQNMREWDETLAEACARYPNMRIYDWAGKVKDAWFIEDGIHFNSPGYAARSRLIAEGLAHAFPAKGKPNPRCIVH
ncbi:MAG TPA: SGNH/GDSL hydrolase family protein, partial [Solirubrobacterales bacterium]|nr:SGNH/GDSL hydrolase family protein [Solirubrobacterales bacterium]